MELRLPDLLVLFTWYCRARPYPMRWAGGGGERAH